MFRFIFNKTVNILESISRETGLSYETINCIVWFIIIPLSWCTMLDVIFGTPIIQLSFAGVVSLILLVVDRNTFGKTLFRRTQRFLEYFERFGISYMLISVIWCIIVPLIIYSLFIYYLFT